MSVGGFALMACSRYAHGSPSRRRQGEATVDADKVTLVLPILGLYAEVYAKHRANHQDVLTKAERVLGIDMAPLEHDLERAGQMMTEGAGTVAAGAGAMVKAAEEDLQQVEHAAHEVLQGAERVAAHELGALPGAAVAEKDLQQAEHAGLEIERNVAQHVEQDVKRAEQAAHKLAQCGEQVLHQIEHVAQEVVQQVGHAVHEAQRAFVETAEQTILQAERAAIRATHMPAADVPKTNGRVSLRNAGAQAELSLKKNPPLPEPMRFGFCNIFRRRRQKQMERATSVIDPRLLADPQEELYGELLPRPPLQIARPLRASTQTAVVAWISNACDVSTVPSQR